MSCRTQSPSPSILRNLPSMPKPLPRLGNTTFAFTNQRQQGSISAAQIPETDARRVRFETLGACRMGISRYPDFEYDAGGGGGAGRAVDGGSDGEVLVHFDLETLHIPPLTSTTTRFLGVPLPPFLRIDISSELLRGSIVPESGKVELEFKAMFWFSVGSIYRAPALPVVTVLTSEESKGAMRGGRGERVDAAGRCRLVGVATIDPTHDFFINTFLGLPAECMAILNAIISIPNSL